MHREALNEKGKAIFPRLKNFADFYLAGGTALALQLGHRVSVDFDFFSADFIKRDFLSQVEKIFSDNQRKISVNNAEELTVFINDVKITFLRYPFSLIDSLIEYEGVKMLSVKEIAATKAYTIGRRGTLKDYIDLYFTMSGGHAVLKEIIELAEKKYGAEFNSRLFLEQLIYLDDIEETEIIFLKTAINKKELEKFFTNEIRKNMV